MMSVCWVRWVVKCVGVVCVEWCCRTRVRAESVGRWRMVGGRCTGCKPLGVGNGASGGGWWMVVSFRVWVAEIDAGRMASQIVKGVEGPSKVNVGQVEVGVVVMGAPLKCWW